MLHAAQFVVVEHLDHALGAARGGGDEQHGVAARPCGFHLGDPVGEPARERQRGLEQGTWDRGAGRPPHDSLGSKPAPDPVPPAGWRRRGRVSTSVHGSRISPGTGIAGASLGALLVALGDLQQPLARRGRAPRRTRRSRCRAGSTRSRTPRVEHGTQCGPRSLRGSYVRARPARLADVSRSGTTAAVDGLGRSLRVGIEPPDGFDGVADELEARRQVVARREDVDHAAADAELAVLVDRVFAREPGVDQLSPRAARVSMSSPGFRSRASPVSAPAA